MKPVTPQVSTMQPATDYSVSIKILSIAELVAGAVLVMSNLTMQLTYYSPYHGHFHGVWSGIMVCIFLRDDCHIHPNKKVPSAY